MPLLYSRYSTPQKRIIRWMGTNLKRRELIADFQVTEGVDREGEYFLNIQLIPVATVLKDEQKKQDLFQYVRQLRQEVAPIERRYLKSVTLGAPQG